MLKSVEELAPELFPFVYFVYGEPSTLFWGNKLLQSFQSSAAGATWPIAVSSHNPPSLYAFKV